MHDLRNQTLDKTIHEYLDAVPWGVLFDAYGRSKPLKRFLLQLHTGTAEEQAEAVHDGLWGHAIHQHTWYTCTIFVVPPVVMALRNSVSAETRELLGFLCQCVRIGTYNLRWRFTILPASIVRLLQLPFLIRIGLPSLEKEIPKARAVYEELVRSEDAVVRERAQLLLDFCARSGRPS